MMPATSITTTAKAAPEFFSIEQVATRWGVNPRTVRRLVKAGHLPAVQIGRQYRISLEAVQNYEKKNGTYLNRSRPCGP
jgi:excisionase family DNA binding protein